MNHPSARLAALLCVVSCVTVAAVEVWPAVRDVRTTDQNGDGRPDVWRHYDTRGELAEVDVDSNFDGRPDIQEYYERGVLVRRESDRNFNGQTDLVEEFDAATHGQTRSVIDVDYDGTADVLVLFRDGHPVFSERTRSKPSGTVAQQAVDQAGDARLVPLTDPFQSETAFRATHATPTDEECIGLSTSGGLPSPRVALPGRPLPSVRIVVNDAPPRTPAQFLPRSPRAPPVV